MKIVKADELPECTCAPPTHVSEEISPEDEAKFLKVISTDVDEETLHRITHPEDVYAMEERILAVHWHPEFLPMDVIRKRIDTMFPNKQEELIIPTQHNELLSYDDYAGVEIDCRAVELGIKIQLLVHFEKDRVQDAHTFKSMLQHTHNYRSSQLFDLINAVISPDSTYADEAAYETGADEDMYRFIAVYTSKIKSLIEKHWGNIPRNSIKNKLLPNYFELLKEDYGEDVVNRAKSFIKAVKTRVKTDFSVDYFYTTQEILEEVRALGGGVVIPHPEQFWPVLLAEYDIDGVEVWNPQSRQFTDFLISVIHEKNKSAGPSGRRLLIFMGDDTHMSEKTKPLDLQNKAKAAREIGLQPWNDPALRKRLVVAGMNRSGVMAEYKSRLAG